MSSQRSNFSKVLIFVASVLVLASLVVWFNHRKMEQPTTLTEAASTSNATNQNSAPIASAISSAPVTIVSSPITTNSISQNIFECLKTAPDAKAAQKKLAEFRAMLAAMPIKEAVSTIRQMLDSKEDVSTQLGFKVANDGFLDETPTLRTFLLDELGRIDPAAAADYAKTILAGMDSPDEWAIALRNLARGDVSVSGQELLAEKTAAMLQNTSWQQNPSVGFLEAFDMAVYLDGRGLMPTLTDLVRQQDNSAVAHASFLALDRLVINDPATTLTALADDPDSMEGRESTRADYFARADVRDPQQKQILENYLLNPQISAAELDTFAGVYPNANYMISPNLLTQARTPDRNSLTERDAESLRVAQEWLADPRFTKVKPELQKTVLHLQEFVRQEQGQ